MNLKQKYKNKIKNGLYNFVLNKIFPTEYKIWTVNQNYICNKNQNNKKVVYTCMTGNYDNVQLQQYLDPSFDYICFTDNKELIELGNFGAWQIRPLYFSELNNQLNNRWHKTHPHTLFPEYDESIYIDSNICLLNNYVYEQIKAKNSKLCIPRHYKNDCVYEEAKFAVKHKKLSKADCTKIIEYLQKNNFPKHYGLNENNIIYRQHKDSQIILIMEEWWNFIKDYCKRDQLSLPYVLWKNNIKPLEISIDNVRIRSDIARLSYHN